jgi:Domain of unknown function (DUF4326)
MTPRRIQLSRKAGFKLQAASLALNGLTAMHCARPFKWGNYFRIGGWFKVFPPSNASVKWTVMETSIAGEPGFTLIKDAAQAVEFHRQWIEHHPPGEKLLSELRGKNLACWCPLSQKCHCDILLKIANPDVVPSCIRCGERLQGVTMWTATLCGLCADDQLNA